jgi:hypothetical protein
MSLLNNGWKVIGGPLSNQSFSWLSEFSNTCALLHYHAVARFLLDSCKVAAIWKASLFLSDSWIRWRSWLSPNSTSYSQQSILNSNLDLLVDTEFLNYFVCVIAGGTISGIVIFLWCKNNVPSFYLLLIVWGKSLPRSKRVNKSEEMAFGSVSCSTV